MNFSSKLFPFCEFPQKSFNRIIAPNAGIGVPVWSFATGLLNSNILFRHYINVVGNTNAVKCSGTWNQLFVCSDVVVPGTISDIGISGFDALIKSGSGPFIDYDISVNATITLRATNPSLENMRMSLFTVIEQIYTPPSP